MAAGRQKLEECKKFVKFMKAKSKIIPLIIFTLALVVFLTSSLNDNQILAQEIPSIPVPEGIPSGSYGASRIEGTGTYFEIKDSEYLNISLKSVEEIKIVLESIPRMISMDISSSTEFASTNLTISGLEPNKTYYKYQDSYKNGAIFESDGKGSYSWLQDLIRPHHIWFQEIKSTVFLPQDCSTYGNWNVVSSTCTLTQNVTTSIEIATSSITLDCNGHKIQGENKNGIGILMIDKENVTIKNCKVNDFANGIVLMPLIFPEGSNNLLFQNKIENNTVGIVLDSTQNEKIIGNEIISNLYAGIIISGSDNNTISKNKVSQNSVGIIFFYYYYSGNIVTENYISNNQRGIVFEETPLDNKIYHNNFFDNEIQVSLEFEVSEDFIFDNGYPSGGNYWSDYAGKDEKKGTNQDQPGNDGIGDTHYTFEGGQDRYPFIKENGWEVPANQPPTLSNLSQSKSDGETPISEGSITTESIIVFKATLSDQDNDKIKLRIEPKEYNQTFNEQDILESDFVSSGSEALITRYGLVDGQYKWRARAVDDKGNVSDWQEFGEAGNVDFEIKLVPLYTQIESLYPSWEETRLWADSDYGTGYYQGCLTKEPPYRSTIARCGCAITSMVMLGRYYDIVTAIDSSDVNPGNINSWLTNNNGYTSNGRLWWGKAIEYLGFIENGVKKARLSLDYYNEPFGSPRIESFIESAKPVIAYSKKFGHYLAVDNKLATTYGSKDPVWYNTKTLNDLENLANKVRDYNNYFDKANLFSYLETPQKISASMYLYLASPAELLVTDPQGRKLGKNPITDTIYDEIPEGIYNREGPIISSDLPLDLTDIHEAKVIYIPMPIDGNYNIQVIGTDTGSYALDSLIYDQNGQSESFTQEGNTIANNIQNFDLNYSLQIIQETKLYRIVDIDIRPGSYPNSINLKSKGVLPVAILSNPFFDAKNVIINSVLFAGAKPLRGNYEDVDSDGDFDLILHFDTQLLNLTPSDTEATLITQLKNSTLIKGTDSIRIISK